jgi:hypothetical protein
MVVGVIQWTPGLQPNANSEDKKDYWCAIGFSSSTGKFGSSTNWTDRGSATRQARENCNADDAECVVLCCNGWCAIALGDDNKYGVGWGSSRAVAEKHALDWCQKETTNAKVVFAVYSRAMRNWGSIAYSQSTGAYGFARAGGRTANNLALNNCRAADAQVIAVEYDCWMALALGDDMSVYGWGHAGNRIDAEKNALAECAKRTRNAKIAFSFTTNGVVP